MTDPKHRLHLIQPHGGHPELQSNKMAEIVYDATAVFCDRYIDRRSSTHNQMVQVTRGGKQNITVPKGRKKT